MRTVCPNDHDSDDHHESQYTHKNQTQKYSGEIGAPGRLDYRRSHRGGPRGTGLLKYVLLACQIYRTRALELARDAASRREGRTFPPVMTEHANARLDTAKALDHDYPGPALGNSGRSPPPYQPDPDVGWLRCSADARLTGVKGQHDGAAGGRRGRGASHSSWASPAPSGGIDRRSRKADPDTLRRP
jgi:hypothetical protein